MKNIKVASAALNQTPLDWENNKQNIIKAIDAARGYDASILCLPELCITGYGLEDYHNSPYVLEQAVNALYEIKKYSNDIIVSVGLPIAFEGCVYNCAALLSCGKLVGIVPKQNLANDGVHYEARWFKPWTKGEVRSLKTSHHENIPFGDLAFNINGIKVGFEICEDAWTVDRVGSNLARRDVDIILNPSASHFAFGKNKSRINMVQSGSRSLNVVYIYANLLGNESGRVIYDGSTIIASGGKIVSSGPRFSYNDVEMAIAIVDIEKNKLARYRLGSNKPIINLPETNCLSINSSFDIFCDTVDSPEIDLETLSKEEEFTQAICLGLFDYMRKSKNNGFVVSLSGGVDSSAVACLVRLIPYYAKRLYSDSFLHKISYTNTKDFLTCIYQSTKNSSDDTKVAAYCLSNELKAKYIEIDVDPIVNMYTDKIQNSIGRNLNWESDDITLQNIQARVRGPGAWMIANINNAILLSTSNRSEAAVGFCSMDGDSCGGLSPIAGIDKTFLIQWLSWVRNKFDISSLDMVLKQKPTAELRPRGYNQSDETDLMPYDLLNNIELLAVRDKKSPIDIFKHLSGKYSNYQLGAWIEKFFILWYKNQWKRERYAPSFHVDDNNLDPKTWCRFPILSGGFKSEIDNMWKYIDNF